MELSQLLSIKIVPASASRTSGVEFVHEKTFRDRGSGNVLHFVQHVFLENGVK